jgi:hypothetical protein
MSNSSHVDGMSIAIGKDKEGNDYVDYFFICDLWGKDPRHTRRNMIIGQSRGLFRINKKTLNAELLLPMAGDETEARFHRAVGKVLNEYKISNAFPDKAHFASG